jgi:RND family efflux transporter MFP subunit
VKKKQVILAAVALAGLILILFWVQGGFHSKVPGGTTPLKGPTPQSLKTAVAEAVPSVGEVTVSGTVTSREVAQIASRVSGYVVELRVDAGDKVEKGQTLLSVDSKEMAERESQAKAALESARAELVRTRNDFERYKVLFEKESVAKKDYDDALARYDVARATEEKAVAALEEAGTMLSYGKVTAPFDGIVGERSVNVGDLATPGRVLLTVYMPGTLEMVAAAGEQYAPFLKAGAPVGLAIPSINLKQKSTIREVVPQRDVKTRTLTVKAPVSETPGLVPGLYGTLTFDTRASEVIAVPREALKVIGQLETVRVLENGAIAVRHVKVGRELADGKIEILSGLSVGEKVVAE